MTDNNGFDQVGRQYAVQSLLKACYAETMHMAAGFLARRPSECVCRPADVARRLVTDGILDQSEVEGLRSRCETCRGALERAVAAWADGDRVSLQRCLVDYRQAAGEVRSELSRLAQ